MATDTALVKVLADNADLTRKLAQSTKQIKMFEARAKRAGKNSQSVFGGLSQSAQNVGGPISKVVGGLGLAQGALQSIQSPAGAAALAVSGVAMALKVVGDSLDSLKDLTAKTKVLSRETGMSKESSSAWIGVADRMGVSSSQLSTSFGQLSKRIQAAQAGTKAADKQLRMFALAGVSPAILASRNMDRILLAVATRFKAMPDGVVKSDLAMKLFGRSGRALIPVLNQGGKGLRELKREMAALGLTVSEKTTTRVTQLNRAQKVLKQVWQGMQIQLATRVIPYVARFAKNLSEAIVQVRLGKRPTSDLARFLRGVADAMQSIARAWNVVKPVFKILGRSVGRGASSVETLLAPFKAAVDFAKSIIPHANGGVVTKPTLALVGEAGPEAIVPLSRPARKSSVMRQAGLAGGGDNIFNIYNYGNQLDERTLAAKIGWQLAIRGVG